MYLNYTWKYTLNICVISPIIDKRLYLFDLYLFDLATTSWVFTIT